MSFGDSNRKLKFIMSMNLMFFLKGIFDRRSDIQSASTDMLLLIVDELAWILK